MLFYPKSHRYHTLVKPGRSPFSGWPKAVGIAAGLSLLVSTSAHALEAGFDCSKAKLDTEKMICADKTFSHLDGAMSVIYKRLQSENVDEELRSSQLSWLKQRNACSTEACLAKLYDLRLSLLVSKASGVNASVTESESTQNQDAWTLIIPDGNVSCELQHKIPVTIFKEQPDLGSGHGSPIDVDYNCDGGISALPFLQKLLTLAETVRSDNGPQLCTGTIIYAQYRYYHFNLLREGHAPDALPDVEKKPYVKPNIWAYFDAWAVESPFNLRVRDNFMQEYENALPQLAEFYRTKFNYDQKTAEARAARALALIVERATGSFSGAYGDGNFTPKRLSALAEKVKQDSPDKAEIETLLAKNPSHVDIQQALKLALARNQKADIIELLVSKIKNLNEGDESALFFALSNKANIALLLKSGAAIDYQNGFGKTSLFYAIENKDVEIVDLLLKAGANPNHTYKNAEEMEALDCQYAISHTRRSPLMHAAQHASPDIIALLTNAGAKQDAKDDLGFNALDYALKEKNLKTAEALKALGLTPGKDSRTF